MGTKMRTNTRSRRGSALLIAIVATIVLASLAGAAMAVSGACCVVSGALFGTTPWLLVPVCLLWGASVVADSAQFSAAIAELAPPDRIGTVLTMQTAIGFLLTLLTIQLMPIAVEVLSWRFAFAVLAVGPLFGIIAMGIFLGILVIGFIYEWKKGALEWE